MGLRRGRRTCPAGQLYYYYTTLLSAFLFSLLIMARFSRLLLAASLVVAPLLPAFAQSVPFTSDKFPNKEALKIAQKAIKSGEELYKETPPRYAAALVQFLEAQKLNANNAPLNLRIGDCYLGLGDEATALPYLQKAVSLETGPAPRTHYVLGRALQLNTKWAEAIKEYEKARVLPTGPVKKGQPVDVSAADINRRIAECKVGQQLMARPTRVFVDNLGAVNSPGNDYGPVVTADETILFMTSRRPGGQGNEKAADGGHMEDIYQSMWDYVNKTWGPARNPNTPLNSPANDAVMALSADGQRMLLRTDGEAGDLCEARLTPTGWSKPKPLGPHINTKYHETAATFSPDGRYIYFVSDKPEGSLGGTDIYKAEIDGKNPPVNLGSAINTPYREEGVFMAPDGKTLYFSSEGHNTMGGLDIFKTVLENGRWSEPVNLGWPINTPEDDASFVAAASGRYGYYASDRPGGLGGMDIYRVTFLGAEKQPVMNQEERLLSARLVPVRQPLPPLKVPVVTPEVTVLKGSVTDIISRQHIQAQIEVYDNATSQQVAAFQTTPQGKYLVTLPSGANYAVVLRQEGYLFYSENVNLPPTTGYAEKVKNIQLQRVEPGSNVVLNNVFFDPEKAVLRPESTAELERLVKLLNETPKLKIHLCGHTDNVGQIDANKDLSQKRAQAVANYLVDHKIKPERLQVTGYGATIPIASNATEAGRQQNRRTEFKVLAK